MTEGLSGKSVLVVDSSPETCELIELILGYIYKMSVTIAKSAREAVSIMAESEFDYVTTGLKLPGASGMEVIRSAQALGRGQMGILLITAATHDEVVLQFIELKNREGVRYLPKPFDPERLISELNHTPQRIVA